MFLLLAVTLLLGLSVAVHYRKNGALNDFTPLDSKNLKVVLALLIVAHHVSYCPPQSVFLSEFNCWGNVVCGCFFFLSGMGLMKSLMKKGKCYFDGFLPKHLWRLFSTLIAVAIVYALALTVIDGRNIIDYYSSLAKDETFVPNTWFVFVMALMYFFFYLAYNSGWNIYRASLLLLLLVLLYMGIAMRIGFAGYWYSSVPAFAVGIFTAGIPKGAKFLAKLSESFIARYILVWLLTVLLIVVAIYSLHVRHLLYAPFLCAVFPVFLYLTLKVVRIPRISFLKSIGDVSYELYVVHGVFIHYLYGGVVNGAALLAVVIVCSLTASYYLNRFINKVNRLI